MDRVSRGKGLYETEGATLLDPRCSSVRGEADCPKPLRVVAALLGDQHRRLVEVAVKENATVRCREPSRGTATASGPRKPSCCFGFRSSPSGAGSGVSRSKTAAVRMRVFVAGRLVQRSWHGSLDFDLDLGFPR